MDATFAYAVGIVMAIAQTLNTFIDNVINRAWDKVIKFLTVLVLSVFIVFIAKAQTLVTIDILATATTLDLVVIGLGLGLTATGTFDGVRGLTK